MMISKWLRISAILAVALVATAQHEVKTLRPLYIGRSIVGPSERDRVASDFPLTRGGQFDEALRDIYPKIKPEKSLLIHDCGIGNWCTQYPFPKTFRMAAGKDAEQAAMQWYQSARRDYAPFSVIPPAVWSGQLASAPFHPLAVVSRLDLATRSSDGLWRNAELRFVYGLRLPGATTAPKFTLILEMVLAPMSWAQYRTLAGAWHELAGLTGTAWDNKLATLTNIHPVSARLRTNGKEKGLSAWHLAQWDFPNLSQTANLTDQADPGCVNAFDHDVSGCEEYKQAWTLLTGSGALRYWSVPQDLLVREQRYTSGSPMSTPFGVSNAPERVRNIVSLEQCSFCHAVETGNDSSRKGFMHVRNRMPQETVAEISAFLQGQDPKPDFDKLFARDPSVVQTVRLEYFTHTASGNPITLATQRTFHDLGRRALHLGSVLIMPASVEPGPDAIEQILTYGPDFVH